MRVVSIRVRWCGHECDSAPPSVATRRRKFPRGNLGALSFPAERGTPSIADLMQPVEEDHTASCILMGRPSLRLGILNGSLAAHVDSQARVGLSSVSNCLDTQPMDIMRLLAITPIDHSSHSMVSRVG